MFYSIKVEELGKNLLDLEKVVQGKQGNLSVVEDGECVHAFIFVLIHFCLVDVQRGRGKGEGSKGGGWLIRSI